jgi:hypothetical protein
MFPTGKRRHAALGDEAGEEEAAAKKQRTEAAKAVQPHFDQRVALVRGKKGFIIDMDGAPLARVFLTRRRRLPWQDLASRRRSVCAMDEGHAEEVCFLNKQQVPATCTSD